MSLIFFVAVGLLLYFWRKGWIFERTKDPVEALIKEEEN